MNEQLKFLIELQEIDSNILSIVEKIKSLPDRLDHFGKPLQEEREAYQKAKLKSEALGKKKKDKDMQLDEIQDKIDKLKSRSSGIKTNKEYEAHLKEIEGIEMSRLKIEDEILALMVEADDYKKILKAEEAKVKKAEDDFAEQEKILEEEKKELKAGIDIYKTKRKEIAAHIDEENYKHYLTLLERSGGLAVVRAENEICLGCNTNIPPQLYNDIKRHENIYTCFYCKRFLYFKESAPPETKPQESAPAS